MKITTSGESHGKGLFAVIEGFPSGVKVDLNEIDGYLALRQSGYGRGARQKIECDRVEILSGIRNGVTLGSPVTLAIWNRDYENWREYMAPEGCETETKKLTCVRPGHADFTGMKKFHSDDARNVLERASARETAARVAAGTLCRQLLRALGVQVTGYVRSVESVSDEKEYTFEQIAKGRKSELLMMDSGLQSRAMERIDALKAAGDTCGGVIELRVAGLKSGFGSCMTYGEKLDARICAALMSVQAVKGVEVGLGFAAAQLCGSKVHDELFTENGKILRKTNRAGGIEGGMSNGEEIVLRAAMKPIPTLGRGLQTVDTASGKQAVAAAERSDVCAIAACETVLENALLCELYTVVSERLGGDCLEEICARYGELQV